MQQHLFDCIESNRMDLFPATKSGEQWTFSQNVELTQKFTVACSCRLPVWDNSDMIRCRRKFCPIVSFHKKCVSRKSRSFVCNLPWRTSEVEIKRGENLYCRLVSSNLSKLWACVFESFDVEAFFFRVRASNKIKRCCCMQSGLQELAKWRDTTNRLNWISYSQIRWGRAVPDRYQVDSGRI